MSVEAQPLAQRVDVGRRARIECRILSGFPVRMVQWLHDGRLIKQHEVKDDFLVSDDHEGVDHHRPGAGLRMTSVSPTAPTPYTTKMRLSTPTFVWPRNQLDKNTNLKLSPDGKVPSMF